jgi:lysophospholipase L1-like esterase
VKRLRTALRYVAHALLFGICLEIAARIDDRLTFEAPLWGPYSEDILFTSDEEGIRRNVPGGRFEKWTINSLGFRGAELTRDKPRGTRRLVCLGQSETFGLWESEGGEWPSRLARLVKAKYPQVEVINASVVGMGRNSRQPYIQKYVLPIQPDLVVLYMNGLADGTSPDQPMSSRRATSAPKTVPNSRILPKLKRLFHSILPRDLDTAAQTWAVDRRVRKLERTKLRGRAPRDALQLENVRRFENHVRTVVQYLRENGVMPILATYPTLVNETNAAQYHLIIGRTREYYADFSEKGLFDIVSKTNGAVRRVAAELRVPLVDVASTMPKNTDFLEDQVHYSDRGAEFVAESVFGVVEQAGLLHMDVGQASLVGIGEPAQ